MTACLENNDDLMMHAYLDGELDPAAMSAFERRLSDDAALRSRYEKLMGLRSALRSLPQSEPPTDLHQRVMSRLEAGDRRQTWSWRALAAAALVGAVLATATMMTFDRYQSRQETIQQVVASHARSLFAPQPFDIASSDGQTVKPWFAKRTVEAPRVINLAEDGFTLIGGRIDVINGEPVATMVYSHGRLIVSLTVLRAGRPVPEEIIAGYRVRSWSDGNFTYVAVCDSSGQDLAAFERAFVTKASG